MVLFPPPKSEMTPERDMSPQLKPAVIADIRYVYFTCEFYYMIWQIHDGAFIVVPLKDNCNRVFGLLGVDTVGDTTNKNIFITHEIQFFQVRLQL